MIRVEEENMNTRKNKLQNPFFFSEYVEDISYVYVVYQTIESISNLFAK